MKIGLSLSRCVKDIVEKKVDTNDVLVIITRTNFDPTSDTEWGEIWYGYTRNQSFLVSTEWNNYDFHNKEHENLFRSVIIYLYGSGKLHQPRQFGARPRKLPYHWLETILPSEELEKNVTVKDAWEKFLVVASLSNTNIYKDHL